MANITLNQVLEAQLSDHGQEYLDFVKGQDGMDSSHFVQEVRGEEVRNGERGYLVKWTGHPYRKSAKSSWVSAEELSINCGLLIKFYEKTKGMSEKDKLKVKVSDKKGTRLSIKSKGIPLFNSKVVDLGPNDCQLASLRIYFGRNLNTPREFYIEQCKLNNRGLSKDNLYNSRIIQKIKIDGILYKKKYVWKYNSSINKLHSVRWASLLEAIKQRQNSWMLLETNIPRGNLGHIFNVRWDGKDFIFVDSQGCECLNYIPSPIDEKLMDTTKNTFSSFYLAIYVECTFPATFKEFDSNFKS